MTHELKIWPEFFDEVALYRKRFELRADDREPRYEAGDTLRLREWDPSRPDGINEAPRGYTGRALWVRVLYVIRGPRPGLEAGFCILSITDPSDPHEGVRRTEDPTWRGL